MHNLPLKKLLCVIAAAIGLSAILTASTNNPLKVDFVASFLIPEVIRDINAIQLAFNKYNPAPIQDSERRGVYAVGYASDMAYFGPKMVLTSIVNDWTTRRELEAVR
ncbi:BMP family ABC transporter substrate-binding protein [Pseudomonas fluorescens]|uniref:BMP family ABC transporter substrate-binding protein n=1 Tax=Pseudomonas fluorescens TaxID=294 RepID=A0A327N0K3_PSEFL|nr:BMP family ABC transporter substrate-binding protein [Pseudomonas fluorescens]